MPIVDSSTGRVVQSLDVAQLERAAREMRAWNLLMLTAAGSGHSGGTMSVMDVVAALFLRQMRLDPRNPEWEDRDRLIFSAGHKAPSLYVGLAFAGFVEKESLVTLRKLGSPFQGHPHWLKVPGVEVSSGSLGQGLSVSNGLALAGRLNGRDYTVYCIMGDGEQQEGQVWEAAMEAGHYGLDNLVAIVDKNRLQIDGRVDDVMGVDPLADKYRAFGWHVLECDGHDMRQVCETLEAAREHRGQPVLVLAHTIKGKGASFMEDVAGWHGKAPGKAELIAALGELDVELDVEGLLARAAAYQEGVDRRVAAALPSHGGHNYWWNAADDMRVEMQPTRAGFGRTMQKGGDDPRLVAIATDISGSINILDFLKDHPERADRWISVGIAEQSSAALAAGLARAGKIPVTGTYGVFSAGRALDQIRTTVCYGNFNVKIVGAHAGVSVGPDGATHQALEDLFQMCGLPNMNVLAPCDSLETERASWHAIFEVQGPCFIRYAREATPIVTTAETPYVFGKANVVRFRGRQPRFVDAFDTLLAEDYVSEGEDVTLVAIGPEVPEAMRAAVILREQYGIEARVLNVHTVKPLDSAALVRAARETGALVTAEEHQVGGLGNLVAAALARSKELYGTPYALDMVGVQDQFGESGAPWELVKVFGLAAEHIAEKAMALVELKASAGALALTS